ncbi:MAG TPA: hypothetical protein VL307_12725, partial [Chitinophagaceae bacterium]|nr:hypothetical protein [Chitinophagaceae bacterium]
IIAVYMLRGLDCTALILGIFAIFFAAIGMLYYSRRKRRLFVAKSVSNLQGSSKIVSITKDATMYEQK